jgi:hypothetical protein
MKNGNLHDGLDRWLVGGNIITTCHKKHATESMGPSITLCALLIFKYCIIIYIPWLSLYVTDPCGLLP